MQRTDLEIPALTALSFPVWRSSLTRSLCFPAIVIVSCAIFGAAQCSAQDVAEAARQERAQKESKQKKSKHVYTEQDLKGAQILTPEERAQVEAKKHQTVPPSAEKSQEAVDAQSLPPDAPLGDVARRFRKQKESQKLQRSAEFHLPFADAPALATPKPPMHPFLRPSISQPVPPSVPPSRPPAARVAPLPSGALAPVAPAAPVVPVAPGSAARLHAVIVRPGDSLWKIAEQNLGKGLRWRELLSVNPAIRDANHIRTGSQVFLPATVSFARATTKFTVKKGDTLTSIAQAQLGHASYWSCIAKANPTVRDANVIFEGQVLLLPASCKP